MAAVGADLTGEPIFSRIANFDAVACGRSGAKKEKAPGANASDAFRVTSEIVNLMIQARVGSYT